MSERPAGAETPWAIATLRERKELARKAAIRSVSIFVCFIALIPAVFTAISGYEQMGSMWLLTPLLLALCGIVSLFAAPAVNRQWDDRIAQLSGHPWQTWPARGEELTVIDGVPTPHRKALQKQSGGKLVAVRLYLLTPQGGSAATFVTLMPERIWDGMTDGYGLIWVCGDLRQQCFAVTKWREFLIDLSPSTAPQDQGTSLASDSRLIADLVARAQEMMN
ncbi:hypothetical protein ACH4VM_40255 [Streptomyces sp. NPDC020792]|uniref:hypothetical protein n=1 Tax=unclassified Streptomyces TaxID=2593676 RepID=UPI0036AF14C9